MYSREEDRTETAFMTKSNIKVTIRTGAAAEDENRLLPTVEALVVEEEKNFNVQFLVDQIAKYYHNKRGWSRAIGGFFSSSYAQSDFIKALTDFLNQIRPDLKNQNGILSSEETVQLMKILHESKACDNNGVNLKDWPEAAKLKVEPGTASLEIREALFKEASETNAGRDFLREQELSPDEEESRELKIHI
jgi:hypothetical protein